MPGQPVGFDVINVVPTEPGTAQPPALIIQVEDTVTLKTYLRFEGDPFIYGAIKDYLIEDQEAHVVHHLHDLITGTMVPTIYQDGDIVALDAAGVTAAMDKGELPAGSPMPDDKRIGYWVSVSKPITTGLSNAKCHAEGPSGLRCRHLACSDACPPETQQAPVCCLRRQSSD